jgi:hypothetical protein
MLDSDETPSVGEDGIPLSTIVNWLLKWWAVIVLCAALGLGLGVAYHTFSVSKYTARIDFSIPESPLGSPVFVQEISTAFLNRQVGADAGVSANPSTGIISLVSPDLSASAAPARLDLMKDSVSSLRKFLEDRTASQYQLVQQDMLKMPDNPTTYSLLNQFRTYVAAQEEKLFDQINIKSETYSRQGLPLFNAAALGFIAGCAFGLLAAFLADLLSGHRRKPIL